MQNTNFNQDWYGSQAKVLLQNSNCVVVDYGCNGRGIVKTITYLREYSFVSSILRRMGL